MFRSDFWLPSKSLKYFTYRVCNFMVPCVALLQTVNSTRYLWSNVVCTMYYVLLHKHSTWGGKNYVLFTVCNTGCGQYRTRDEPLPRHLVTFVIKYIHFNARVLHHSLLSTSIYFYYLRQCIVTLIRLKYTTLHYKHLSVTI